MTLQEEVSVLALHLRSCHTIDMHIRNKQSSVYSELGMLKYARMQFIVISITQNQITWNLIGINLLNIYIRGSFQKTFFTSIKPHDLGNILSTSHFYSFTLGGLYIIFQRFLKKILKKEKNFSPYGMKKYAKKKFFTLLSF